MSRRPGSGRLAGAARSIAASTVTSVVATAVSWLLFGRRQLADVVMVYLLGIILVSLRFGYGPSIVAAVLSVLLLDFFFVPPYLSFAVSDFQHVVMFAVMFVVAVVISHLTRRVRLQADEAHRANLRVEAERLRSTLLSSVSHDLRTPLSVITGAASALLQSAPPPGDEARRDLAETIHEEAHRLDRLVRNLLDMTRLASGAVRVTKDWHPLEGVVGAALERLAEPLHGRNVEVRIPPDLPPVPIDDLLVEQVLINLLENAAKYTPSASPVEISTAIDSGAVVVAIADRGPGIPPELADRIFEKFYRLPREGASGGGGLGLAICRGIVEAHGGRIWVEGRDGGGAVFRFTLPLDGPPPQLAPEDVP
jgi:two-component system, OmpR family, sensor histidine kinase KdpD